MAFTTNICLVLLSILASSFSQKLKGAYTNPSILQDSRDLPRTDGGFGFLYRTEDGIAHAAVGEPGGQVHGRFTYTDPTGLKVNFNYNAGTKTAPGYNYEQNQPKRPTENNHEQPRPQPKRRPQPQPVYEDYDEESEPQYQPQPRPRPSQPEYDEPPRQRLPSEQRINRPRFNKPLAPQNDIDHGSYSY